MTAGIRRWTRRRQSNHVSDRMAAVWSDRTADLGSVSNDLLGENRLREMVAVALLLILKSLAENPPSGMRIEG
jgi:hypothetical protein